MDDQTRGALRDLVVGLAHLRLGGGRLHAVSQALHRAPDAMADDIGDVFDTVQGVVAQVLKIVLRLLGHSFSFWRGVSAAFSLA